MQKKSNSFSAISHKYKKKVARHFVDAVRVTYVSLCRARKQPSYSRLLPHLIDTFSPPPPRKRTREREKLFFSASLLAKHKQVEEEEESFFFSFSIFVFCFRVNSFEIDKALFV